MIPGDESLRKQYAARFQDQSVVERYHLRPAYPPEVFTLLQQLIVDESRAILDVGCGPGTLTRRLLDIANRIDAVDISPQMLEQARNLPGGDSPKIRWLLGRVEEIDLQPPYALITAGRSLHWLDWGVALPRFSRLLTPRGVLAVVQAREQNTPWREELRALNGRYSPGPQPWHRGLIEQLEQARLFQRLGEHTTSPMTQHQSIEEYIAGLHSRSTFSLDHMPADQAARFDAEARTLLTPFASSEVLTVEIVGHVIWGKPLDGREK